MADAGEKSDVLLHGVYLSGRENIYLTIQFKLKRKMFKKALLIPSAVI